MEKTKKRQSIFIGLILILGAAFGPPALAADPVPGNLIANPDMQIAGDNAPQGWTLSGFNDTFTGSYPVAGPAEGDKAVQITTTVHTDGDAKWIFNSVAAEAGALYSFSDRYKADVSTQLIAAFTATGQAEPTLFSTLVTLPATGGEWQTANERFTVPLGYDKISVYHVIAAAGTLATANYSLVRTATAAENLFSQGMVSLTFDDGWSTQYDNALPILKDAGLAATFFMISQPLSEADALTADNLISAAAHPDIVNVTDESSTSWSGIFTDPTVKSYRFDAFYTSTAAAVVEATYQLEGGEPTTVNVGNVAASPDVTGRINLVFTLPGDPADTVSPLAVTVRSETGTITVTSPRLTRYFAYMDSAQMLEAQTAGIEIGNHTVKHCNLVTGLCPDGPTPEVPDDLTAQQEINDAKQALLAKGATPIDTIAYPYGATNEAVKGMVSAAGHTAGRTVTQGFNTRIDDKLALKSQVVTSTTTQEQVAAWIDEALANKWWLILVFHQVEDQATIDANNHTGAVTPETLAGITAYLQDKPVVTFREGASLMIAAEEPTEEPSNPPSSGGGGGGLITGTTPPNRIEAIGVPLTVLPSQSGRLEWIWDMSRRISVEWPADAFTRRATVTARIGTPNISGGSDRLPSGAQLVSEALFQVGATDTELGTRFLATAKPYKIKLNLPLPGDTSNIGVYRLDEATSRWVRVSNVAMDPAVGEISFETGQLGLYGVFNAAGLPANLLAPAAPGEPVLPPAPETGSDDDFTLYIASEQSLVKDADSALASRLSGRILLQVEENGEAWYVNPTDKKKYFLGRPADAFTIMRRLSLGISNRDFNSYTGNKAPQRLAGRILLKVEDFGRAYYVNPLDLTMHYLGRPADAFALMRRFGLGITNENLRKISVGELE